jgi:hypothetical protein
MNVKQLFNFCVNTAILFMSMTNLSAQVTIGALKPPHNAAVLDLSQVPSQNLGLLMPYVNLAGLTPFQLPALDQQQEIDATGMIIYNLAENASVCPGLYVWEGFEWRRLQEACSPYIPPVIIDPVKCTLDVPPVRFMAYNLGADPDLDTPKKQMEYLITKHTGNTDAHVYGGLYQWGRSDLTHGASSDYIRYSGTGEANHAANVFTDNPVDGIFYHPSGVTGDWRLTPDNALWGNGEGLTGQPDANGGVKYTDNQYYQNTDWTTPGNNPCPDGFRVPTQDEWERLMLYDCNPSLAGGTISGANTAGHSIESNNLTWVPVACSNTDSKCIPQTTGWNATTTFGGYAIYLTAVWSDAVADDYRNGTYSLHVPDAPDPLLYLPVAGMRNPAFYNVGVFGYYWTSTSSSGRSYQVDFRNNSLSASLDGNPRSYGMSIRCVSE